mmetsp:Transcript_12523/g.29898  ORF Transcript_12523/g.29898 Transcript_12523/m.29898 type:complete len:1258 (+) Transcript_12523:291-4064(+)|eukprot:CAMPEP_0113652644 /NCGR_PEP_ID=MMETSP0017_2-20120614/28126_1 /TAXON_ID=2856 /ORGANISM="Cylindrotheca closterium" /LENGTH=1257 /DNA_ID=CAMNT_0000565525 /DNA_START=161 /DNA_END=3934 /DNA_ORIENTATION=+ /assembly_acc=CAM_ASM_000147
MSDESKTGSLLGKILLPGYTDAGPDSSFKPVQVASMAPASQKPDDDDDAMSEAATEIFDNRSHNQHQRLPQAPRRELPKEMQQQKQQLDIPRASPRKGGENNYAFFPSTKPMPSPRPISPPRVTRRQVSTSSVAATSTVPETGAFSGEELERQEKLQTSKEGGSYETGAQVVTLSEKALQAMDEKQTTSSSEDASGEAKQRTSLIENDDASSCVSSTASEMGTVINIGSDRFAEIEAMAAMVEANADVFEMQEQQMQQEYMRRPGEKEILSLPILEGRSFEEPALLPAQSKSFSDAERGQDLGLRMKTTAEANDNVTTTPSINHQNHTNNPTTSAMVSAAIRRIGTGMKGKSMSAPNTPKASGMLPKVEDLLKSTLTPGRSTKESSSKMGSAAQGVLRSPGGNSMFAERPALTPRFSRTPRSEHDSHLRHGHAKPPISPSIMLPGLQFARKCFSHDTTFDEYPFPVAEEGGGPDAFGVDVPRSRGDRYSLRYRPLQQSQSWDVGHGKNQEAAFRARHHAFGSFQRTASHDDHSDLRQRLNSDNFSPRKFSRTPAIELQTSQRIETEREDALDILACLVERGVERGEEKSDSSSNDQDTVIAKLSKDLKVAKEESKKLEETKDDEESKKSEENISVQADVLDLLLKSHSYASEMRQATTSASSWLHSIGRGAKNSAVDMESKEEDQQPASGEEKSEEAEGNANEGSLRLQLSTLKAMLHSAQAELKEKSEANEKLDAELSKCRAEIGRLKSASRSEPLHLSANKSILDISGNDGTGNETPSVSPEKKEKPEATLEKLEESKILDDSFNPDNSVMHGTLLQGKGLNESVIEMDQLNSAAMREALNQANETIRRLHSELKDAKKIDDDNDPPIVAFSDNTTSQLPEEKKSASDSMSADLQTINVRMLDGENFVTEWTDLTPPLPPPPDHGLRSPIVNVVLEQWTTDRGLHDSLLAWIDRVMTGIDLESSVPPLTISSLDHQVRDGFVMHVLPLLLRRADIHVDVQTRAHRRTSYDMSVTVTQKSPDEQIDFQYPKPTHALLDQQHHVDEWAENFDPQMDNKSVAHSAVTEHMSNSNSKLYYTGSYKASQPPIGEYSSFAEMVSPSESQEMDQSTKQEPGMLSALGGALGGFLSRRKGNNSGSPSRDGVSPIERAATFEEAEEPYHRVVSAPPGRIGVTFVEYRGHAMVSDVSPDSPLSSWIYPSDILIAIDDTPVSGMRVRDIVKVLTNRRDQQRALRVISSHAMNEFTLNQSAMVNEPT